MRWSAARPLRRSSAFPGASRSWSSPQGASADESAPFASATELARLRDCKTEATLVAAITPLLRAARGFDEEGALADPCARLLLNSEAIRWLDALHAPLPNNQLKKPDLFATWVPFWEGHADEARGGPVGKLASRALQLDGCVREFYEAKVGVGELTPADFGQLLDYHSRVRGPVRGVLFNAAAFWLCASVRDKPQRLVKGRWAARGSRAALRRFLDDGAPPEPAFVPLLRFLLQGLRAQLWPVEIAGGEGSEGEGGGGGGGGRAGAGQLAPVKRSFLGAGGSARVFAVRRGGSAGLCALKASVVESRSALEYEFRLMTAAAAASAPVAAVVPDSLLFLYDDADGRYCGGGFLLAEVLGRVSTRTTWALCDSAFDALRALHAAGFVHGDARLPNLLWRGGGVGGEGAGGTSGASLVWVDMRLATGGASELPSAMQRADRRTLAASLLGRVDAETEMPAAIEAAISRVPAWGAGEYSSYRALARAVWDEKR